MAEERQQLAGGPISVWGQDGQAVIHHASGLTLELSPQEQTDLFGWLSGQVVKNGVLAAGTPSGQAVTIAQTQVWGQWNRMEAILYRGAEVNGQRIDILDIPAYGEVAVHARRRVCLVRDATEYEQSAWRASLFYVSFRSDPELPPDDAPDRVVMPIDLSKEIVFHDPLALARFGVFLCVAYPEVLQGSK